MNKERGWWVVVTVGVTAITVSLLGAWQSTRDPLPHLPEHDRRVIFESNWKNFSTSCLAAPAPPALQTFCREQGQLLQRLPECGPDCQRQTSSFTTPEPSR